MAAVLGTNWGKRFPFPVGNSRANSFLIDEGSITPDILNNTRKIVEVPFKIQIVDCFMQTGDLDTGTALVMTLRLNDGTTQKTLIHQTTVGQAGGIIRPTKGSTVEDGIGFTTNSKIWWLEILYATAAGTAQAGNVKIGLTVTGFYAAGAAGSE